MVLTRCRLDDRISKGVINNRLLLAMPSAMLERLRRDLHAVTIDRGQTIHRAGRPIEHLYFVNRGFISVIKTMLDGRSVEVGGVGIEGVTGANSLLAVNSAALDAVVQIPGTALRIRHEAMKRAIAADDALKLMIVKHARLAFGHMAQQAACNRLHTMRERCCRWLLIAHDSSRSDQFLLIHEFLAQMLGVQRAGVSIVARQLKDAGLIDYTRGRVAILDRAGLEASACECYRTIRDEWDALLSEQRGAPIRRSNSRLH